MREHTFLVPTTHGVTRAVEHRRPGTRHSALSRLAALVLGRNPAALRLRLAVGGAR